MRREESYEHASALSHTKRAVFTQKKSPIRTQKEPYTLNEEGRNRLTCISPVTHKKSRVHTEKEPYSHTQIAIYLK